MNDTHRGVRSGPGEPRGAPARTPGRHRQSQRQPDLVANDHHRRDDVPAALALLLFGGEALEGFAFTMLVGIACGTYSTVFIASAMAIVLSKRTTTLRARG